MSESFLGVTAHFVHKASNKSHRVTLACQSFTAPHTAARIYTIVDKVINEFGLKPADIFAIVTENGFNLVAAFKEFEGSGIS